MPEIPVLWRWRHEDQELKVILSYPGQPGLRETLSKEKGSEEEKWMLVWLGI